MLSYFCSNSTAVFVRHISRSTHKELGKCFSFHLSSNQANSFSLLFVFIFGFVLICPQYSFMRVDTLSMLLSLSNVGPYTDALVLDKLGGLVVGSVAERVGGALLSLVFSISTKFKNLIFPLDIEAILISEKCAI